jgi:hypothetical protein
MTAPERHRLPNRRLAMTTEIEVANAQVTATVGFDATGRPAEVFLSGAKDGSGLAAIRHRCRTARQERPVKDLIDTRESGGRNVPNYRYDASHTAGRNLPGWAACRARGPFVLQAPSSAGVA